MQKRNRHAKGAQLLRCTGEMNGFKQQLQQQKQNPGAPKLKEAARA